MAKVIFDEESRQFSVVESDKQYSLHPITGEAITPAQYKKVMIELAGGAKEGKTGLGDITTKIKGRRELTGMAKGTIDKAKSKAAQETRAAIAAKAAQKGANKELGKKIAKAVGPKIKAQKVEIANQAAQLAKAQKNLRNLKIGAGVAAGTALAGGAAAYIAKKRAAKKKAEENA